MASRTEVETVRAFNRFYTRRMGLTRGGYAKQSLAEARVLYELGANDVHETGDLRERLDIDAGQLSRLLTRLEQRGLAERAPSPTDGRRQAVRLTADGRATFDAIDAESGGRDRRDARRPRRPAAASSRPCARCSTRSSPATS